MKKSIGLSLVAATLLAGNAMAMDLAGGKLTGDARALYMSYDDGSDTYTGMGIGLNPTYSMDIGGGLSFEVGAGVAVPVTESDDAVAGNLALGKVNDDGDKSEMYAALTKANITYGAGDAFIKAGYQQLDTPFAGSDDIRLVPNSFLAAVVGYTGIKNVTLIAAQVLQMAGRVDSSAYDNEQYQSMSDAAVAGLMVDHDDDPTTDDIHAFADNDGVDDNGVTALAAVYADEEAGINGQFWYYTMSATDYELFNGNKGSLDALTAMYADAGMKFGMVDAAVQYISQDIGGDKQTSLGAKADIAATDVIGISLAYNSFSSDDGSAPAYYAWGGYPEYAVADELWANSADWDGGSASKVAVAYSGIENLSLAAGYVSFSDVGTGVDLIAGYTVNDQTAVDFVYETVDPEADGADNTSLMKLKATYSF